MSNRDDKQAWTTYIALDSHSVDHAAGRDDGLDAALELAAGIEAAHALKCVLTVNRGRHCLTLLL